MSYAKITKRIEELASFAFPQTTIKFVTSYTSNGECVVSVSKVSNTQPFAYAQGVGLDADLAAAKMFENFVKYLTDVEAAQSKALVDFQVSQSKHVEVIREALKRASDG